MGKHASSNGALRKPLSISCGLFDLLLCSRQTRIDSGKHENILGTFDGDAAPLHQSGAETRKTRIMRTLADEIGTAIEVDLAVMPPHQRRAYAGLDQYRRPVEVRGVQELAKGIAESFGAFAIFDVETVLQSPAIAPFITQTLYAIPLELRRAACDRDRHKAESARKEMARIISAALLARYHFEPLKHVSTSCHPNWEEAFEQQFGAGRGGDRHE